MSHARWVTVVLALLGLVAGGFAGAALAEEADTTRDEGTGANETDQGGAPDRGNESRTQAQEQRDARLAYIQEMRDARMAALDAFHENRTAAVDGFNETMRDIRETYLAHRDDVQDACRGDGPEDMGNASEDERQAFAECVREGLELHKEEARAAIEDAREDFRSRMTDVRDGLISEFHAIRDEMRAHFGQGPSDDEEAGAQDADAETGDTDEQDASTDEAASDGEDETDTASDDTSDASSGDDEEADAE